MEDDELRYIGVIVVAVIAVMVVGVFVGGEGTDAGALGRVSRARLMVSLREGALLEPSPCTPAGCRKF